MYFVSMAHVPSNEDVSYLVYVEDGTCHQGWKVLENKIVLDFLNEQTCDAHKLLFIRSNARVLC